MDGPRGPGERPKGGWSERGSRGRRNRGAGRGRDARPGGSARGRAKDSGSTDKPSGGGSRGRRVARGRGAGAGAGRPTDPPARKSVLGNTGGSALNRPRPAPKPSMGPENGVENGGAENGAQVPTRLPAPKASAGAAWGKGTSFAQKMRDSKEAERVRLEAARFRAFNHVAGNGGHWVDRISKKKYDKLERPSKLQLEQARAQIQLNELYKASGVEVQEVLIFEVAKDDFRIMTQVIDFQKPSEVVDGVDDQVKKLFGLSFLLGDLEVLNGNLDDHFGVDGEGNLVRLVREPSSSAGKAEGGLAPGDLWAYRAEGKGWDGWEDLSIFDVADQMNKVLSHEGIGEVDPVVRDLVANVRLMQTDQWKAQYVDKLWLHRVGLKKAGVLNQVPKKMDLDRSGVALVSVGRGGKRFEGLRGRGSCVVKMAAYMEQNGGDQALISTWMADQTKGSWQPYPQAVKAFLVNQRDVAASSYYWAESFEMALQHYNTLGAKHGVELLDESIVMWHAMTQELLAHIEMPNNDIEGRTIKVIRTEHRMVMRGNPVGTKGIELISGPNESGSMFEPFVVHGNCVTERARVPHHRIFATYLTERTPGKGDNAFSGDRQNEFLFMGHDLPCDFTEIKPYSSEEE